MADMFGAPIGIGHAEADQRQQVLGALQAMHQIGQIEQQPIDMQLKQSHARLYAAQAAKDEAAVKEAEAMALLGREAAAGRSFNEVDQEGKPKDTSLAVPLERLASMGFKSGLFKGVLPYAKAAVDIRTKEATRDAQGALELKRTLEAEHMQNEQRASQAAALANAFEVNPALYDQWRMAQTAAGVDESQLPTTAKEASAMFRQQAMEGIKARDSLKLRMDEVDQKSKIGRRVVQNAVASARIEELKASTRLKGVRADKLVKEEGPNSPSAVAAREEKTASQKALRELREAKLYPKPLPEEVKDPSKRTVNQTYTLPTGRYTWNGVGWIPFTKQQAARAVAADVAADEDESDDDGDD